MSIFVDGFLSTIAKKYEISMGREKNIMKDDENMPAALQVLNAAGMTARRMDYAYMERGGTRDAARKLGLDEHAVVKSLVFDNGKAGEERRAVMVLMHGDRRVSLHRLERLSGIPHLQPSSPETAEELTGYRTGGICPFALKTTLPVFMQETLLEIPEVFVNAGTRGVIAAVSPQVFRIVSPIIGNLEGQTSRSI